MEKTVNIPYDTDYIVKFNTAGDSIVKPLSSTNTKDLNVFGGIFSVLAMILALAAIIYAIVFLVNRNNGGGGGGNNRKTGINVRVERRNDRRNN
jgi:hypothetical protein